MNYRMNNISYTTYHDLCTGCGICEDVCPTHSISIKRLDGEYRPVLNTETCLSPKCGKCLKVCPGIGVDINRLGQTYFGENAGVKSDKHIGNYLSLYTGYSLDGDVRYHSASGGIVSQYLIYLLEKRIIDGAVVTSFSDKDHITPASYIARTKEDVLNARSSKYCPVALNKVGNEICRSEGKYVIVGLPCHIQGFRKRAGIDKRFRERVVGYFTIYCSSNRTFNAQEFLFRYYQIEKKEISYFAYRDNGCLGSMVVRRGREDFPSSTTKKSSGCMESKSLISIPYIHYYGALRSFFKPRRCLTCIDHYGELADVCFGDIHIKPYSDDKVGISSWIVRNPYFDNLFKQAAEEGYIKMDTLDAFTLNESQKVMLYPKKGKAKALMNMDRMFRRRIVDYNGLLDDVKPSPKDYLSMMLTNMQRYIGRDKRLWFVIDYFFKKR